MFVGAGAGSMFLEQAGVFGMGGAVKPGVGLADAEEAVVSEIKDLVENGVTDQELQKARNNLVAQSVRQRARVSGKAQRLGYAAVVLGDIGIVNRELDLLMKVSTEDVHNVAKKYFKPERQLTLVVTPAIYKLNPFRGLFGGKKSAEKKPAEDKKEEKE